MDSKTTELTSTKKELSKFKDKCTELKNLKKSYELEIEKLSDNNALKNLEEQMIVVIFLI